MGNTEGTRVCTQDISSVLPDCCVESKSQWWLGLASQLHSWDQQGDYIDMH